MTSLRGCYNIRANVKITFVLDLYIIRTKVTHLPQNYVFIFYFLKIKIVS